MDAEAIAKRLWPDSNHRLEVLGGGLTNHNYKVTLDDGDAYVLRIAGRDTHLLGIDRAVEHEISLAAAAAGVGPQVVAFVQGCLVTRFIEGTVVPIERMTTPEFLNRVAAALRAVHSAPPIGEFDSFRVVEAYRDTALARGGRLPEQYDEAAAIARRIERSRAEAPRQLCHNDLLNANFIDDGVRIRIVDWEYAGMGDAAFDLGNFSINHELTPDEDAALLAAYAGEATPSRLARLTLMRVVSDFREAMWGVLQQGISTLDVDFVGYAGEHFDRLLANAATPRFERALTEVAGD